jgi:hypothetical protein
MDTPLEMTVVANGIPKPELVEQNTTVHQSTALAQLPTWLHSNLRNLVALFLTGIVCWLAAFKGDPQAMTALIAAFSVLMGALWGERAALKVPGQDS